MSNRIAEMWQYRPGLPYPWNALKCALEGWDVKVLIVHRPLYDYLPSVYTEQFKITPNKIRLQRWYGDGGSGTCPSQGGRVILRPFDTRRKTKEITIARLLEKDQVLFPTPAQVYELFRDHGFTTILVDMMERFSSISASGTYLNFVEHIICDKVPGTIHTCEALLKNNGNGSDNNKQRENEEETAPKKRKRTATQSILATSLRFDCHRGMSEGIIQRDHRIT
jgi:hypothetical protein